MKYRHISSREELESQVPDTEAYLATFSAENLKKLARVWFGKEAYKMNKATALAAVAKALQNQAKVREMVEKLSDFERAGLGLVKARGGSVAYIEELAVELLMLGFAIKGKSRGYYGFFSNDDSHYTALKELLNQGLLGRFDGSNQGPSRYYPNLAVFADARVLAEIEPQPPLPLKVATVASVEPDFVKRPTEVLLRLVAFREAVNKLGGIPVSAKGAVAKPALAKLSKALGWKDAAVEKSPTPLPDATEFYVWLWEAAGLLKLDPDKRLLTVARNAEAVLEKPFAEQARLLAQAYPAMRQWVECRPERAYFYEDELARHSKFNGLRAAVLMALAALPEASGWYRIDEVSEAIYERIGQSFALGYRYGFYAPYNTPAEQVEQLRAKWMKEQHSKWRESEYQYITHTFVGPLFHLGLVELAYAPGKQTGLPGLFRLTQAGRAGIYDVLRDGARPTTATTTPASDARCWIIQPNFEVIVYLESATPPQLGFIERVAERLRVDAATATYRLTREATYAALESGIEADTLIQKLQAGCRHAMPKSIVRSLTDWAMRRERIAVRLDARVLEFADAASRDAAIATKRIKGEAIGVRFALVSKIAAGFRPSNILAYEPEPPKCLAVNETGALHIKPDERDLLIAGELAAYCESKSANGTVWQITRASVRAAIDKGWTAEDILHHLTRRALQPLPPILVFAIRAWSGGRTSPRPLALPMVSILQVADKEVADAIGGSKLLQRCLASRLGPGAFLVKPDKVIDLITALTEFGFIVGEDVMLSRSENRRQDEES